MEALKKPSQGLGDINRELELLGRAVREALGSPQILRVCNSRLGRASLDDKEDALTPMFPIASAPDQVHPRAAHSPPARDIQEHLEHASRQVEDAVGAEGMGTPSRCTQRGRLGIAFPLHHLEPRDADGNKGMKHCPPQGTRLGCMGSAGRIFVFIPSPSSACQGGGKGIFRVLHHTSCPSDQAVTRGRDGPGWATEGGKQQESCGFCSPHFTINNQTQNAGIR